MEHKFRRSKLVQYCIQLNSKTAVTFLVYDSMFVNSYSLLYDITLVKICFCIYFTNQTLLQLSGFSICNINPSLKESSLEFWCNVTLNNCMSLTKRTSCISYCNWSTGIGRPIWNETPQLICQCLVMPFQQFKTVMQKAKFFCIFTK